MKKIYVKPEMTAVEFNNAPIMQLPTSIVIDNDGDEDYEFFEDNA